MISRIILPGFEQIMELSETSRMIYFHESIQQIVLSWPYFYPFLLISSYAKWRGKFDFSIRALIEKKCSKTPKLFHHVKFTFLSGNFFPVNEKSFTSSFLQSLHDGLACLLSTPCILHMTLFQALTEHPNTLLIYNAT